MFFKLWKEDLEILYCTNKARFSILVEEEKKSVSVNWKVAVKWHTTLLSQEGP
jgi:hypothetical protein